MKIYTTSRTNKRFDRTLDHHQITQSYSSERELCLFLFFNVLKEFDWDRWALVICSKGFFFGTANPWFEIQLFSRKIS